MSITYTVKELNQHVKILLESQIGFVSVMGELSNLTKHRSGHCYFTLKDQDAQIRCAFFYQNQRSKPVAFEEGMQVLVRGKLSLYEARGDYQLIIYALEEAGIGMWYQQFERLKKKLDAEGLFDPRHKRTLPTYPQTIGVITSPQAAALRDILITLYRRYPLATVILYPSEVQGQNAPQVLCRAIETACMEQTADLLLLARGGGSLEDLCTFNDEKLARTIFAATLPIVTGIGHETDVTIADFVADARAATPTAAAILATPDQSTLVQLLQQAESQLSDLLIRQMQHRLSQMEYVRLRLKHQAPLLSKQTQMLTFLHKKLVTSLQHSLSHLQQQLNSPCRALTALNPLDILNRGFSVTTQDGTLLIDAAQANLSRPVRVQLAKGELLCEILESVS